MSASGSFIHSVQIYNDSGELISRLCGIISSRLQVGDAVLIIATARHRDQLVKSLSSSGVDVRAHAREGRYTMLDAKEMLTSFLRHGKPDPDLFSASIGVTVDKAQQDACSKGRNLMIFGEMVAVLWEQGKKEAALELEQLWNEALEGRDLHLHCAYHRAAFMNPADENLVCAAHSHVLAAA